MGLNPGYALAEFYLSLVAYFILHMIFVIASDFVEAFNIPPLNIGIYVDKLAAIRALLMVLADFFEWGITQKVCKDWHAEKSLKESISESKGARRLGSILSFVVMLSCRVAYLILIYKSDNKSLSVFITLCVEGFWFGVFQMSFFAVGPEFNALTSFGIHTMGNFIFMLQVILQRRAKKKPKINCLYRVRVHAWIVVVTSLIALCIWIYFCYEYSLGDSDLVKELKEAKTTQNATNANASDIAEKLAEKMKDSTGKQKVKDLVKDEFGYTVNDVNVTVSGTTTVEVKIGGASATHSRGSAIVKVQKLDDEGQPVKDQESNITIQVKSQNTTDISDFTATRIAKKLGSVLTKVNSVKSSESSGEGTIKIKVSLQSEEIKDEHAMSPFLLFIIGAFAEDFAVPGVLPFAFLDPEKANLVNYLTPSFFMTGALMTVFVDSVFEESGFAASTGCLSRFKAWSEGKDGAYGWHGLWTLNVPKYIAFFIAMWSIHGTYDSLRCIIQSRWRVLILTMTVVVPRAFLETAGYVGVANWSISSFLGGNYSAWDMIAWHDVTAMFCRFVYGKFAVGYNWTKVLRSYS